MKPTRNFRRAVIGGVLLLVVVAVTSGSLLRKWTTSTLPYCEVARNAEKYHGQFVTVKARVIFGSDGTYIFEDCDPGEALASLVEVNGDSQWQPMGHAYVEELLVDGEMGYRIQQADAIVAGRFNGKFTPGCWAPKFKIAATKIELVSPITDYVPQPALGSGMRTRH